MPAESDAIALMDMAIEVAQEELRAMQKGEVEEVETLFARRTELVDMALKLREAAPQKPMRDRMLRMQALEEQLVAEGKALRAQLAAELSKGKQEVRRMRAYGQSVRQGL